MFVQTPKRMAGRFKPNRKAIVKPTRVCRPKNGEKPKKIPLEKARAVLSGVSSTCRSLLIKFLIDKAPNLDQIVTFVRPICNSPALLPSRTGKAMQQGSSSFSS